MPYDTPSLSEYLVGEFLFTGRKFTVPRRWRSRTSMTPNIAPASVPNRNVITIIGPWPEGNDVPDHMVNTPVKATSLTVIGQ